MIYGALVDEDMTALRTFERRTTWSLGAILEIKPKLTERLRDSVEEESLSSCSCASRKGSPEFSKKVTQTLRRVSERFLTIFEALNSQQSVLLLDTAKKIMIRLEELFISLHHDFSSWTLESENANISSPDSVKIRTICLSLLPLKWISVFSKIKQYYTLCGVIMPRPLRHSHSKPPLRHPSPNSCTELRLATSSVDAADPQDLTTSKIVAVTCTEINFLIGHVFTANTYAFITAEGE